MWFTLWFLVVLAPDNSVMDVISWHDTEQQCQIEASVGQTCIPGEIYREND